MRRTGLTAIGVVLLWAVGASVATLPAPAATEDGRRPRAVTLDVSPRTVQRGAILTFTGSRWPARSRVNLLVGPPRSEASPVGVAVTDARGRFVRRIRISRQAMPGPYVALACRNACRTKASASFRIQ